MGNMNCCSGRVKQQPSQNIDSILFPTQPNVEDADLYFQDDSPIKNKQMTDHFDSLSSDKFTETPEFLTSGTSPKYPTAFQTLKPKPHIQDIITFDNESIQQDTIDIPTSELNESQLSEDLDYMLDQAAELSQIQQRQIISLFEKYANQYINVFEELDGYLDVVQYNADDEKAERIILISTLAVYIMDPDDFTTELRRIPLDAIILLRASRSLKHLLIQVDDEEEKGDVCVFTDRMSDLVRAIQSVYYEMRGYYVMIQFEDSLEGLKQKMNSESTESIVDLNYSVAQNRLNGILIRRGNIGETIQKLFQCVLDDQERWIMKTTQAIYILSSEQKFILRISNQSVNQIEINKAKGLVSVLVKNRCYDIKPNCTLPNEMTSIQNIMHDGFGKKLIFVQTNCFYPYFLIYILQII